MKIGIFLLLAAVLSAALFCGCLQGPETLKNETIGGERDGHGCLGPAGYGWDDDVGACIRSWELNGDQKKAAKIAIAPLSYPVTIIGVDSRNCSGCFTVHLQRNDNDNRMDIALEDWQIGHRTDRKMTLEDAIAIAKNSNCVTQGSLMNSYFYNPNSRTWWIDLDVKKEGCAPACVVSEDDRTAEINWRCTGLIVPDENESGTINSFEDCVAAGYPIMKSNPPQCAVPGGRTFIEKLPSEPLESVADANNRFAFDLYSKYMSNEGNIFFSPYSISIALAMTFEGAKGQTAEEMLTVMQYPRDGNTRRLGHYFMIEELNRKDKNYTLSTANALWAQKSYPFLQEYFAVTEKYYGGNVTNLDFEKETEKSRLTINDWVQSQTNDKIKDLIPAGVITPDTALVLTNAIYFKGNWLLQFDKNATQEKDFKLSPGKTVKARMMSLTGEKARFNYTETDKLQALEMPYDGEDLSMLVLLPKGYDITSMEKSIDAQSLATLRNGMTEEQVNVYMPRYKFETKYFMADTLKEMGMPTAFSDGADFSGMTGKKDLFISQVIHQAFVEVNEEGTEAAAATAVIMDKLSAINPDSVKTFNADHPFLFIIQEKKTGNILFMGRVSDPTK